MKRGRPKGYSPYAEISYEELADYVGRKTLVKVCKSWLDDLVEGTRVETINFNEHQNESSESNETEEYPKIEYELTTFE
ncbi:MAG: hypothetical protein ACR2ON_01020 [Paracoccaceae bacterium]